MRRTRGQKIFSIFNYIFLLSVGIVCIYPFIYVLAASMSSPDAVMNGTVWFIPQGFTLASFKYVMSESKIWIGYGNTIFYAIVGTIVNLIFSIMGAYPLSKKRLMGRKFINLFVVFTLWFNAGIIPWYLNFRSLGLLNSRLAIIIGFAVNAFFVIILRSFFTAVPIELEESAKIDGASDLQVLFRIYLPLSKAALATVGLFYAISRWNGYFWAMTILRDQNKLPLQVILREMIMEARTNPDAINLLSKLDYSPDTIIYATIIMAILPIVLVYPYIQKFFVKGIMIGSVKG